MAADALRHRDVDPEVKEKLIGLFRSGHSPSSALQMLKYDMEDKEWDQPDFLLRAADRRFCPDMQYCYRYVIHVL